jgi:hypothetical protein
MLRALIKWIRTAADRYRTPDWMPEGVRRLARWASERLYRRYHVRSAKLALSGRIANLDDAEIFLRNHLTPLHAPMAVISQVQRSGGTLLSQLFDGHPELCAYPSELKFDFPSADRWPLLDPARGAYWNFQKLFDSNLAQRVRRGFIKGNRNPERFSFMLMSRLEYRLFEHLFETSPASNARGVIDHFFTAFFNAWLNYQGDLKQKRLITAFAPRLAHDDANIDRFFADYPDGWLIQIARDPKGWYPSAKNHAKSGFSSRGAEYILDRWRGSAESMLRNRRRYGDRVVILRFEDIVARTEPIMRALADRLGIGWDPILLEPTFNREPMRANSSFAVETTGIIEGPLNRAATLSADEHALIEGRCSDLYKRVLDEALTVSAHARVVA